jgi:hypothetical protein
MAISAIILGVILFLVIAIGGALVAMQEEKDK